MSSDESASKTTVQDETPATTEGNATQQPPAAAGSEPQPPMPVAQPDPGEAQDEKRERRLRLNPTFSPADAKPIPSLEPAPPTPRQPAHIEPPPPEETAAAPRLAGTEPPTQPPGQEPQAKGGEREAKPKKKREEPIERLPPGVAIPRDQNLDDELAAEIEAAMSSGELGGTTPDVTPGVETAPGESAEEGLEAGKHLTGKIQSIRGDDVFLDLGLRSPGILQKRQFVSGKRPEVGQMIEVIVDRVEAEDGLIVVNLPKGMRKVSANWDLVQKGQVVDAMVTKTNKGGLEVNVGSLRAFLPASQVEMGFSSDLEPYVGQKLRCIVTEVNPKKRNLVVSRRAYLQIERKDAEEQLWKTLEVGQTFPGRVKTIKDYGVFVDIGGVDGFLHIGEISWTRVRHPKDILQEGQQIEVKVIALDAEKKKISLGMRQLTQDPWKAAADKYATGTTVSGKVTRVADFGGFVELEPGIEGLVHVSELDHKHVKRVGDVLKPGQTVEAQVLEVDSDRKRISLSLKALKEKPPEIKDEDLAPSGNEPYQRKHRGPLKGGTSSNSGGGLFGNPRDFNK